MDVFDGSIPAENRENQGHDVAIICCVHDAITPTIISPALISRQIS
jgi:hypothetical protein